VQIAGERGAGAWFAGLLAAPVNNLLVCNVNACFSTDERLIIVNFVTSNMKHRSAACVL